ncbi:MAG: zinc ribbon domain-containing protein [Betaproteobacteria bacterium]|nr:zinc ribbon domain-containing protein [Betaproteobacteria bacterium]
MPSYDFRCPRCRRVFEVSRRIGAADPLCPGCGGAVEPVFLVAPAVHGVDAAGRELAARSLPECGKGCSCCP